MLAHFEVVGRFGDSAAPQIRAWVAAALYSIAVAQAQLGRGDEALAAYDDLLARFGDERGDEIRPLVVVGSRGPRRRPRRARRLRGGDRGLRPRARRARPRAGPGRARARRTGARAPGLGAQAARPRRRGDRDLRAAGRAVRRRRAPCAPPARRVGAAQQRHRAGAAGPLRPRGRRVRGRLRALPGRPRSRGARPCGARPLLHGPAARAHRAGPEALAVFEQVVALYGEEPDGFAEGAVDRARRRLR